jgi:hypothetical protein
MSWGVIWAMCMRIYQDWDELGLLADTIEHPTNSQNTILTIFRAIQPINNNYSTS